jgi:integrase
MGLTRRKDGFYVEFRVIDDGEKFTLARGVAGARLKRWKTGTNNRTQAKDQETCIKRDLMLGIVKTDRIQGPRAFKALAEVYKAAIENKRQASYFRKVSIINNQLLPVFAGKLLDAITVRMAENYREQRRCAPGYEGTCLKSATINREVGVLKHMLSWAVRERWLKQNPLHGLRLEKENNERDRIATPEEFNAIQSHIGVEEQLINLIAYQTGMREGEILNLEIDRIDMKAGFIRLKASDTKTDDDRIIPLSGEVLGGLREHLKVHPLHDRRVFRIPNSTFRWRFNKAVELAGMQDFRFHDLRHTAITNMRRAGIDAQTIMRISGHKTMAMFLRYNSFHEEDLKAAASQMNTYLTRVHLSVIPDSRNSMPNLANHS